MLFQHIERQSFIHGLNPMVKFLGIVLAVITLTLFDDPVATLFVLLLALWGTLGLARIPPVAMLRSTLPFLGLAIGLAWINMAFSRHTDAPLVAWGVIHISEASMRTGLTLGLRMLAIISLSYLFAATTNPRDMVLSMVQQARLPYRLAFGLFAGLRFLPLMSTEFETIRAAQRIRGLEEQPGWRGRLQTVTRLTIPLCASVIRRASHLGTAMESRGFGAYADRTYLAETRVTWRDGVFLVGLILILAIAGYVFLRAG